MRNIFRDEFGFYAWVEVTLMLLTVLVVLAALAGVLGAGINHSSHVACTRLHEQTGLATTTVGVVEVTCFIYVPHVGWVRSDQYRGVEVPI